MSEIQQITWLIGSPKAKESTSEALGAYFTAQFENATVDKFQAHKIIRREKDTAAFIDNLTTADLLVISFPLYVDALPYVLTKTLELVLAHYQTTPSQKSQRLVCIANCGFPEAHHNNLSLEMCQVFAQQAGFTWAGGISIGGGGTIHGTPLENLGNMTQNYRQAFQESAKQIQAETPIHPEILARFTKPIIPNVLYIGMGSIGWMVQAHQKNNSAWKLWRKPYKTT